jgi:hypothetical protein
LHAHMPKVKERPLSVWPLRGRCVHPPLSISVSSVVCRVLLL